MFPMKRVFLSLFVLFLLGCSSEHNTITRGGQQKAALPNEKAQSGFAWVEANVLIPGRCTQCHGKNSDMDLTTYQSILNAVSPFDFLNILVPGNPEGSKLYTEIASGRMPLKGPKMDQKVIDRLGEWIRKGAIEKLDFDFMNKKIFTPHCNKCHGEGGDAFFLDFTTHEGVLAKIDLADPKNSRIYKSVVSGRMPKEAPPLSKDDADLILQWIVEGAKK